MWSAPTTDRDRKELLRTIAEYRARLAAEVALPRSNPPARRTDEETIGLPAPVEIGVRQSFDDRLRVTAL
ncbi:hypothetical protein [Mesorhizobium sp. M0217]|uniref:hypothetical protein n=1 Tax=unclassified Mesorhizobium TaxID=325217 RepID=UPI00333BDA7E